MIYNEYGDGCIYLCRNDFKYAVPNYGQIPREFAQQSFHEYSVTGTTICLVLDDVKALSFAKNNGLMLVTDEELTAIIENGHSITIPKHKLS